MESAEANQRRVPLLSIIAAVAENGVIGRGGELPWRLSADLRRFKELTMGRPILMGRKTYESIGRPLPGRRMIVITRQTNFRAPGAQVARSLDAACGLAASSPGEVFIIGGSEIYQQSLSLAARLYLTRVHASPDGDARFPAVDFSQWRLVAAKRHSADAKNQYDYSFENYERVGP